LVWTHLELKCKSYERNKKQKKKFLADRTKPGPAGHPRAWPHAANNTRRAPRSSPARARPAIALLKYVYLKLYNLFFGSVCFYTFLTRNLSFPTDLPLYIYSPHLRTSKFLSPKSQNPLSQNIDFNLWASKLRYLPSASKQKL
jgi:hypothetical protein